MQLSIIEIKTSMKKANNIQNISDKVVNLYKLKNKLNYFLFINAL